MSKVTIARPINGISLNGTETLLHPGQPGIPIVFENKQTAIDYLREHGYEDFSDDDMEDAFLFNPINEDDE